MPFPTMREYAKETRDYVYFGDSDDWRLIAATHRDDDSLGRVWFDATRRIVEAGLAELLPGADPRDYLIDESDSHWLVGHSTRLLCSPETPAEIIDELERWRKTCDEEYPLASCDRWRIDVEEMHSELEYNDGIEVCIDALMYDNLRLERDEATAAASFVWSAYADRNDDYLNGDRWPDRESQFYGYLAYRRYKRNEEVE